MTQIDKLRQITMEVLSKVGVPNKDAKVVADSILYANMRGKHTHGIGRLPIYVRKIKKGLMDLAQPSTVQDSSYYCLKHNHG